MRSRHLLYLLLSLASIAYCKEPDLPHNIIELDPYVRTISNYVVWSYLDEVSYDTDDYSQTYVLDYCTIETDYRKDQPFPFFINSICDCGLLIVSTDSLFSNIVIKSRILRPDDLYINNLEPLKKYYWKVVQNDVIKDNGRFIIPRDLRMCKVNSIYNVRDLGGWSTGSGYVRYGLMYRGSEMTGFHGISITDEDIDVMKNDLGIKTVLDFRKIDELRVTNDNNRDSLLSPLGEGVTYYYGNDYDISSYSVFNTREEYRNCFLAVLNSLRNGDPIYFHCWGGNDRTGTFVFLLLGVLGVSESDLCKEYELSSFSSRTTEFGALPRRRDWGNNERGILFREFVEQIKQNFEGYTFYDKIRNYWLSVGVNQAEIDELKELSISKLSGTSLSVPSNRLKAKAAEKM